MKQQAIKKIVIAATAILTLGATISSVSASTIASTGTSSKTATAKGWSFGVKAQPRITEMSKYVQVLAHQIKRYNQVAPKMWPNNKEINQYALLNDVEDHRAWLITPTGQVTQLTRQQLLAFKLPFLDTNIPAAVAAQIPAKELAMMKNMPLKQSGYWSQFKMKYAGKHISGGYFNVSNKELKNTNNYKRYPHLGTYDVFITYAHEMFHSITQANWKTPKHQVNVQGSERMKDTKARAKTLQLVDQLRQAVVDGKKSSLLAALATYKDYKKEFPSDYKAGFMYNRAEGTAYYYELHTSLMSAYPNKIHNSKDVTRALKTILKQYRLDYLDTGAVAGSYNIGAFAGILLDQQAKQQHISPNIWKEYMGKHAHTNPIDYLAKHTHAKLPKPKKTMSVKQYKALQKKIYAYKHLKG
ncbi:hypothetical protein EQG49_13020 [Periweissella cryptocerci]|uniref:Uncharacterized protein n=1 Tax=Periweissella cryptocerci TaxID=2506420 RepID=A0A4P6YWZ7_9LACO|nr:hypothetical protein [Periweissella cryptocerci]QBO37317.1 hypothetical protein EQG49_13020 [Periweissella cryptocerci]